MKLSVASRAPLDSGPDWDRFASDALDDVEDSVPPSRVTGPDSVDFGTLREFVSEVRVRCAARVMIIKDRGRKWESE